MLVWSDFFVPLSSAEAVLLLTHPAGGGLGVQEEGDTRGWVPGVSQPPWHRGHRAGQGGEGLFDSPGRLPQLCGAGLKPRQFRTLCVLLEWVLLLSGAPDADRQWFPKKEAESFLSSYWREPGGCLRQRRQHWWWPRSRVGLGFHIHHHNGRSCTW